MADKRPPLPKVRIRGTFKFPRLGEPDTKFKADGEYSVKVVVAADAAEKLIAQLQPIHDKAVADGKVKYAELPVAARKKLDAKGGFNVNGFCTPVYDDEENETGEVEFNVKMQASGTYKTGKKTGQKWNRKPPVFDAKGKPMDGAKVWGGSFGIVNAEVSSYFIGGTGSAGISLRLEAVQVIDLVSGGKRSASSYGFEEEDGYEDDGEVMGSDEPDTVTGDAAGDEEDF